ncbi:MAG: hypothetical protein IJU80_09940 [Lachnospiraceae bacterium]|nr:hypothetical protein [Lachnospiraceae bacterium]
MKKKRHRAKSDILIDLTSLLDVIFIVLLVVIGRQMTLAEKQQEQVEANGTVEEAMALAQDAQAKYELYMDQVDTAEQIGQYVCVVSVYAYYNEADLTERYVQIYRKGDAEPFAKFELKGEYVEDSLNEIRIAIEEYAKKNDDLPVILTLNENDEKILYRDEREILRIFGELRNSNNNIF